jgi:hypothetical protein
VQADHREPILRGWPSGLSAGFECDALSNTGMEACVESASASERRKGFGRTVVSEATLDVGRSWRTRKGALEARGRQRAEPGATSVEPGEASMDYLSL